MLENLADGQIEFYKAVRVSNVLLAWPKISPLPDLGNGRVGANYTRYPAYTR